ncbi:MAG: PHP domain-containing protein [Opitutaceae bacterium]
MTIRVACHVHSDWSYDGCRRLNEIASIFGRRQYRAVLMSEHDRGFSEARRLQHREACRKASTPDTLLISGLEYSDPANRVHILTWGDVPFVGESIATAQLLAETTARSGVAVMAHPTRQAAWQAFDTGWSRHLAGIELWNRKTDGWAPSRDAARLLAATGLPAFVGLDFHRGAAGFPLTTLVEVETPVDESTILTSLACHRFACHAFGASSARWNTGVGRVFLEALERRRRTLAKLRRKLHFPTNLGSS